MSAPFHRPNLGVRPQQISFAGQVESIDGDLCRPIDVAVGPADFHCVGLFQVGHTDGDSEVVARQIALVVSHIKYAILAAGGYGDASPDAATIALHPFGPNLHPVVPVAAVIVHLHHPHEKTKSNSASTLAQAPYGGRRESGGWCAGINRQEAEDEKSLRGRSSEPLGPEFCFVSREAHGEA